MKRVIKLRLFFFLRSLKLRDFLEHVYAGLKEYVNC